MSMIQSILQYDKFYYISNLVGSRSCAEVLERHVQRTLLSQRPTMLRL